MEEVQAGDRFEWTAKPAGVCNGEVWRVVSASERLLECETGHCRGQRDKYSELLNPAYWRRLTRQEATRDVPDSPGRWRDRSGSTWDATLGPKGLQALLVAHSSGAALSRVPEPHSVSSALFMSWGPYAKLPDSPEKPAEAVKPAVVVCGDCGEGPAIMRNLRKLSKPVPRCDDCWWKYEDFAATSTAGLNEEWPDRHAAAIKRGLLGPLTTFVENPLARPWLYRALDRKGRP